LGEDWCLQVAAGEWLASDLTAEIAEVAEQGKFEKEIPHPNLAQTATLGWGILKFTAF